MKHVRSPVHLSREAQQWYRQLRKEYGIEDVAGLLLLQTAMEAYDRMRGAQAQIAIDGLQPDDRFAKPKAHTLLATERDARAQMLAALKSLNLDLEPLRAGPGRPGQ